VKRARQEAMRVWTKLNPKPKAGDVVTFETALEQYIEDKNLTGKMAPRTEDNYRHNLERYLDDWKKSCRNRISTASSRRSTTSLLTKRTQN
jgi:hypothetical protein